MRWTRPCLVALFGSLLVTLGCGGGGGGSTNGGTTPPLAQTAVVAGQIQKGPFISGTTIQIQALNNNLNQTGVALNGVTTDNFGAYSISTTVSLTNVEVIATGFYYDEINNRLSSSPVTLRGFSSFTNGNNTVNVNILSSLSRGRILQLVGSGMTFSAAKTQAEGEVLHCFGIAAVNSVGFEKMDLSGNSSDDGILLAVSATVQQIATYMAQDGSSIDADLTSAISALSTDIQNNGKLDNATNLTRVQDSMNTIRVSQVSANLISRYQSLGKSISVANFSNFITKTVSLPESFSSVGNITATPGNPPALVGDPNGGIHLFYFDSTTSKLMWGRWTSGVFGTTNVGSYTGSFPSAAVDTAGNAYISAGNQFITNKSGSWVSTPIQASATFNYTSVAIDNSGVVGIAFINDFMSPNTIYYATYSAGNIVVQQVVPIALSLVDSTIGYGLSLAFDSLNQPHIAFNDRGTVTPGLRHAVRTGGAWTVETIDGSVTVSDGAQIRIRDSDTLYILYKNATNNSLKVATKSTTSTWSINSLANTGPLGSFGENYVPLGGGHFAVASGSTLGTPGFKYLVPFTSGTYVVPLASDTAHEVGMAVDGAGKTHLVYRLPYPSIGYVYQRSN